ncbi:MAG: thioredoxin family protein, partial [Actinomycetota bacterium]
MPASDPREKMAAIAKINDENFSAEVTSSEVPILVDFWAEWCHPCHMIAPELEALAVEQSEHLRIGKLN